MRSVWTRWEPLGEADSLRRLGSVRWGRLAWSRPEGPRILPINFAVLDRAVFLRTELHGSLAEISSGSAVALEADELDERLRSGWSVVASGRAEQVHDPAEVEAVFRRLDEPWAPGSRPVLVRIDLSEITGRSFSRGEPSDG